jgi:tRNA(Ile)-lysidine synthase
VADRDVVPVLARQAALVADEAALLDEMAAHLEATDVQALRSAPPALARRAVRRWLTAPGSWADAESHPPSSAEVARVLAVAGGSVRACEIAGGRRVERRQGRLRVIRVDPGARDFGAPGDFGTVGTPGGPESRLARG